MRRLCWSASFFFFFFFKQKTAYEMRISDWSSDVCSSDLFALHEPLPSENIAFSESLGRHLSSDVIALRDQPAAPLSAMDGYAIRFDDLPGRSEEHTSELQSLMRISYAVFCLKKKKQSHYNLDYTTLNVNR